ncbi:MAG: hypothetical protein ABIN91_06680 [Mucilaginibacter sp.]
MQKAAIIGTGIAGIGCGHFLNPIARIALYRTSRYIGDIPNTVTI